MTEKEQDTAQDEQSEQQDEQSEQQDEQSKQKQSQRPQSHDGVAEESGESGKVITKAAADSKKKRENDDEDDKGPAFSLKRLHWAELVGFLGAGVLAFSLFLPWFSTSCDSREAARAASPFVGADCNPRSVYNGKYGEFTGFETFKYLDWLLLAACIAPFILAYIIARGHQLTWKPGEVTMIVGMTAFALVILNGIILGKPGDTVDMDFSIGWPIGLIGATLIMFGGILRQALAPSEKKPPGVM